MRLSDIHNEALESITDLDGNQIYLNGYPVPKGRSDDPKLLSDASHFHILYIDILPDGKRHRNVPVIQKYQPKEWDATLKVISNPIYGINATGHDEFSVLWDPRLKEAAGADEQAQSAETANGKADINAGAEVSAEVKPEQTSKPRGRQPAPKK